MAKKLLSIQYPPFYYPDFGKFYFEKYGFDVYRCDIGKYAHLEKIDLIVDRDLGMKVEEFDAVSIYSDISEPFTDKPLLFPENEILKFKNYLETISKEKKKEILFIGVNVYITEAHYSRQSVLFGLFISKGTPPQTLREIYNRLHLFATKEE